jgi:hypothetical protein
VPARDVWHNEAGDFTPWLASNLDVLFDHLELDVGEVTDVRTEVPVGPFRLDLMILTESGRRIAIENQLDTSDHSHLGQLLLYAAGLEADVLVWIATRFRPEYRAALDWLNAHTGQGVHLFGVQLGVVRIGTSAPAPVFDVVCEPNDWEEATRAQTAASDVNLQRQAFYRQALEILAERVPGFRVPKTQPQNWQAFKSGPFGNYGFVFTGDGRLRVEVYLDAADPTDLAKRLFDELHADRERINNVVGTSVEWERLDDKRASRLCVYRPAPTLEDPDDVDAAAHWAAEQAAAFIAALDERMRARARILRTDANEHGPYPSDT